jgi:hypothetical protein
MDSTGMLGGKRGMCGSGWLFPAGWIILLAPGLLVGVPPTLAGEGPPSSAGLTINQFMRCPEPPSDSVLTLEPSGAAKIIVLRGMDKRTVRTLTNYKQLTGADMDELTALLRASKFERMPEASHDAAPRPSLAKHPCRITLEIHLDGKQARLRYDSDPESTTPAKALAMKIDAILDRYEWSETVPR